MCTLLFSLPVSVLPVVSTATLKGPHPKSQWIKFWLLGLGFLSSLRTPGEHPFQRVPRYTVPGVRPLSYSDKMRVPSSTNLSPGEIRCHADLRLGVEDCVLALKVKQVFLHQMLPGLLQRFWLDTHTHSVPTLTPTCTHTYT